MPEEETMNAQTENILRMMAENTAFNRWLEDPSPELFKLKCYLEGREVIDTQEGIQFSASDPDKRLLNDLGVQKVMHYLKPLSDKNTTLSNISEKRLDRLMKSISRFIRLDLIIHGNEYELKPSNYNLVCNMINYRLFFTFSRPVGQGERRFIKSTYNENVYNDISNKRDEDEGFSLPFLPKKKQ